MQTKMKAAIFVEPGRIVLDEKPIPDVGPLDALIRITTTTICGTDVHILKGEYPVARGLTIGHEPVGVIEKLGSAVQGYRGGPARHRRRDHAQRAQRRLPVRLPCAGRAGTKHGWKPLGGWRFGNTIDGSQAEYVLVPDAMANLAPVPDGLTDEQVLMCPDIMSTGFSGAESGGIRIGDTVAVFAQGPIGLCADGRRAADGRDDDHRRRERARRAWRWRARMGADHVVDFSRADPVEEIMRLTDGRGVDVAIEALGHAGDVRGCAARAAARRHAVVARRLFGRSQDSARRLHGRARRPHDRDDALPRRQGAHAAADGGRSPQGASTRARW